MALPKKNVKLDINIDPPKIGREYLKYGLDRIEELMMATDRKTNYLPRTIRMEDIDDAIFEYVNTGELDLVIDNKDVPTFYLDNDRWGEFSKTWRFMDSDKNVPTPYLTVRRSGKEKGTRLGTKYRIAQGKTFRYLDVPILDDGQIINLRFKIPEPVNIDLIYDISLFTKYRVDVNQYDEQIFRNFASRQGYIFIKGSPMPVHLETIEEPKNITNIDGDRYFVGKYLLRTLSYLQDEKEFEIVKTTRKPLISINIGGTFEIAKIVNRKAGSGVKTSTVANTYKINVTYATITDHFDDIPHMISLINSLKAAAIYYVKDASDDPNISSGFAYYEFKGKNYGDIRDFRLMSSENALASIKLKNYTWVATENQTKYVVSPAVANEIYQIDDFLIGGVKQINNTTISTENVTNDSVTIDIGLGTIPAGTTVYLEYFTKIID